MIKLNLEKKGKAAKATLDKCRNREVAFLHPISKLFMFSIVIIIIFKSGCKLATLLDLKIIYNH